MNELVPGGNLPLPDGPLTLRVPGPFDVSAIVTDTGGKVRGDADFVFYNQPSAPGVRLVGEELTVHPTGLRGGAERVTVIASPADPSAHLGSLPAPTLHVTGAGGRTVARFTPQRPQRETVLLLAELYRRGGVWKLRALGQGYADGLAGVARDFGVDVVEDAAVGSPPVPEQAPGPHDFPPPNAPAPDGFLGLVNAARARAGSPPVSLDARLTAAAHAHAAGMAAHGALATESADGTSVHQRITARGYTFLTVGEHLVSGPRTPAEFVEYCLGDERSRRTLCTPEFTEAGAACVAGGRSGDLYWTALWARPFTAAGLARTAEEVLALTNTERAAAGLAPLAADPRLAAAAQAHSADMVARDFYAHTSPEGREPWDRAAAAGSRHRTVGENIACGQRSPAEVVRGWMNSPGHRANILKPAFTHLGVGFVGGGRAGTYWTQLFGG
ncbi:CAP domain-containing protein [Streptomyces chiangmaiensis]|uniref:CAP domain-containing protein n=1 Tax=Streptomyces chiangmaiensis TaxID=766497 RepID=A0ABU7FB82_9ACTN|nr:CAP domain-containing protein [Streptomyces chiangmaiensis]MED7821445.1 CAP domain-containing protein [Streptomyces chiangmaiensis]